MEDLNNIVNIPLVINNVLLENVDQLAIQLALILNIYMFSVASLL